MLRTSVLALILLGFLSAAFEMRMSICTMIQTATTLKPNTTQPSPFQNRAHRVSAPKGK
jgi:hypothetical protein